MMKFGIYFHLAVLVAMCMAVQSVQAQGQQVLSNTNQPVDGIGADGYGAYDIFMVGPNPTGYRLTDVDIQFGDNSAANYSTVRIELYASNSPINPLDQFLSGFTVPVPRSAGLYSYVWPTNVILPGELPDYGIIYYTLFVIPYFEVSGEVVNVAYTTSTNFTASAGWTLLPTEGRINGTGGLCPICNIYATVMPPPIVEPIRLIDTATLPDGSFQFGFTNTPGLSFSAYAATNLAIPFTNWLYAGDPQNIASNYYLYNSGPGVVTSPSYPRVYFRVTSP